MFIPNFKVTNKGIERAGSLEFASDEMQLQWAIYERLDAMCKTAEGGEPVTKEVKETNQSSNNSARSSSSKDDSTTASGGKTSSKSKKD